MAYLHKYVGIPFKEKGSSYGGCDCWGLVKLIYKHEYKIELNDFTDGYENTGDKNIGNLVRQEQQNAKKTEDPKEGDILVFNFLGEPLHVGIWISAQRMLHVMKGINASIEKHNKKQWAQRLEGVYTYDD